MKTKLIFLIILMSFLFIACAPAAAQPTQPLFPEGNDGEEMESARRLADPDSSVQEKIEQKELSQSLYKSLEELPDVFRSALTLVDVSELDYLEASQIINVSVGTIKSRIARARLYMQKKLKGYDLWHSSMTHHENRQLCL